jgi:hypothetical protein
VDYVGDFSYSSDLKDVAVRGRGIPAPLGRKESSSPKDWYRRSFDQARYLYVGSHGLKKQIIAPDHGINSQTIINQCKGSKGKGYFFSACDFVNPKTARDFLVKTKAIFIAGYSKNVPWLESILVDLFFLSYLLQGRVKRQLIPKGGSGTKRTSLTEGGDSFVYQASENPMKVAQWVYEDLPLAALLGFDAYSLQRSQGKMPRLISASRARLRRQKAI